MTNTTTTIDSASLHFHEGVSDKVYHAAIETRDDGCIVTFAYGRRGSTLTTGTKTPKPVPLEQARKVFDKLVKSKLAKGYRHTGESAGSYHRSDAEGRDTGIRPQLCNPISREEARALLKTERFCLQEKIDGRRMLVRKTEVGVNGINRRGLQVGLPGPIASEVERLPGTFLLDGEAVGDRLHVFDLLDRDGVDHRGRGLIDRLTVLEDLLHDRNLDAIVPVPPAFHERDKRALWALLVRRNAEGVVFKARHSASSPGRPASGGDWLKFKFVEMASFIVAGRNGTRRSVGLALVDADGALVSAGNVTIPANHTIPGKGTVCEVRYLYAHRESGAVYQPIYLGPRDDIPPAECTVDQLKYKPGPERATASR